MIYSRRCHILGPIKSDPGIIVGSWKYLLLKILLVAAEREPLRGQHRRSQDLLISHNATVVTVLGYFTRGITIKLEFFRKIFEKFPNIKF